MFGICFYLDLKVPHYMKMNRRDFNQFIMFLENDDNDLLKGKEDKVIKK